MMKYYSAMNRENTKKKKKKPLLIHVTAWLNLKSLMLDEEVMPEDGPLYDSMY